MSITPTGQRDLAINLVVSDPGKAALVARAIEDPWFKCQALAYVARYSPQEGYEPLLREACKAAQSQDDWYKRVAVSAWPVRAYLELENPALAKSLLERSTDEACNIGNMGSRSEALFMLFQAAKPFGRNLWQPVLHALMEATHPALAWRQTRNVRLAMAMVAADDPKLVQEEIMRVTNDKAVAAIERDLGKGVTAAPRTFFGLN